MKRAVIIILLGFFAALYITTKNKPQAIIEPSVITVEELSPIREDNTDVGIQTKE